MMSGDCAIGSPCIATRPASTVTMAMTMATIGRLMKKRDMNPKPGAPLLPLTRGGRRLPRLRVHHAAVPHLRTFDDDAVAGLKAGFNDPAAADPRTGLDRSRGDP